MGLDFLLNAVIMLQLHHIIPLNSSTLFTFTLLVFQFRCLMEVGIRLGLTDKILRRRNLETVVFDSPISLFFKAFGCRPERIGFAKGLRMIRVTIV